MRVRWVQLIFNTSALSSLKLQMKLLINALLLVGSVRRLTESVHFVHGGVRLSPHGFLLHNRER